MSVNCVVIDLDNCFCANSLWRTSCHGNLWVASRLHPKGLITQSFHICFLVWRSCENSPVAGSLRRSDELFDFTIIISKPNVIFVVIVIVKKRRDYELGKYMYTVLYSTKTLQDTRMKLIGIDKWTNVVKICMNPTQIHCKDCLLLSRTLEWYCNILRFTKKYL